MGEVDRSLPVLSPHHHVCYFRKSQTTSKQIAALPRISCQWEIHVNRRNVPSARGVLWQPHLESFRVLTDIPQPGKPKLVVTSLIASTGTLD